MDNLTYQGSTAWMIRRDGSIFPVVQHIYGNPEDVEETLFAAEWLYERTRRKQTRKDIKEFIRIWKLQFAKETNGEELKNQICGTMDINGYCRQVALDLNEEFIRVRFGGKYHTEPGNRKLYFRVSSENYNWSRVMDEFSNRSYPQLHWEKCIMMVDQESAEVNPVILKQRKYFLAAE